MNIGISFEGEKITHKGTWKVQVLEKYFGLVWLGVGNFHSLRHVLFRLQIQKGGPPREIKLPGERREGLTLKSRVYRRLEFGC